MKVQTLRQTHPEYDGDELKRLRALHDGGAAWRALIDHWLPQYAREMPDVWTDRKRFATYHSHFAAILGLFAAKLFAEPASVEGVEGEYWDALWDGADSESTPWSAWWREAFLDALIGRRALVWVDLPERSEEAASLAGQLAAGQLDAKLTLLAPEQVIDWGSDNRGLAWVMVHGVESHRDGPDSKRSVRHLWTWIDRTHIRRWEWVQRDDRAEPAPEDIATELPQVAHGFGRLPIVPLELPVALHAGGKLRDPCIAHSRSRNDLSWALHVAANALLVIKSKWNTDDIVTGHGYFLRVGPDDDVAFVSPDSSTFEVLARDVDSLREEVYRVLHQMQLAANGDAQAARLSGESKAADAESTDIILAAYATIVRDAMAEVVRLIAAVRGEDADVTVKGLEGWASEDIGAFIERALLADPLVPSETYRRAVAKRIAERTLGDEVSAEDLDAIRREIEQAPETEDDDYDGPDRRPPRAARPPTRAADQDSAA